jgi:hypothetical protein
LRGRESMSAMIVCVLWCQEKCGRRPADMCSLEIHAAAVTQVT